MLRSGERLQYDCSGIPDAVLKQSYDFYVFFLSLLLVEVYAILVSSGYEVPVSGAKLSPEGGVGAGLTCDTDRNFTCRIHGGKLLPLF